MSKSPARQIERVADAPLPTVNPKASNCVVLGYFGGTNYGDELLLELYLEQAEQLGVTGITVPYQRPNEWATYHHERDVVTVLPQSDRLALIKALLRAKYIVMPGGGHWGMDMNPTIIAGSVAMFGLRFLGKKVELLGIGAYGSTNRLGTIATWCAAKSASLLSARDHESLDRLTRFSTRSTLAQDWAHTIPAADLSAYQGEAEAVLAQWQAVGPTIVISLRRFSSDRQQTYESLVSDLVTQLPDETVGLLIGESRDVNPGQFDFAEKLTAKHPNCHVLGTDMNPVALALAWQQLEQKPALIALQYHFQIAAHLAGWPIFPITYDNKVTAFINDYLGAEPVLLDEATLEQILDWLQSERVRE